MCRVIKVAGESLTPLIEEGDFVLVVKIPFFYLRQGDVIVFRHPEYGTMIKLVEAISHKEGIVFVVGTHPASKDSRSFGPVARREIIGKVFMRINEKN